MKVYTPIPSLAGILSDDYLYFEGVSKPADLFMVREDHKHIQELEKYWNDIYNLFLRKLTLFAGSSCSDEESLKLQALLQELVKVKRMIENDGKADIM